MGRHNGNSGSRIANRKRAKHAMSQSAQTGRKHHNAPPGVPGAALRTARSADAMANTGKPTAPRRAAVRTFPSDAIIPETHGAVINAGATASSGCILVLARRENVLAQPGHAAGHCRLLGRSLTPLPIQPPEAAATAAEPDHGKVVPSPVALPLPAAAEPLVLDQAPVPVAPVESTQPVPRERALVAPATGLVGKILNWLSGSRRRLKPEGNSAARARGDAQQDRPDVALMRAQLRELRAELAIARRVAERREVLASERAREGAQ